MSFRTCAVRTWVMYLVKMVAASCDIDSAAGITYTVESSRGRMVRFASRLAWRPGEGRKSTSRLKM